MKNWIVPQFQRSLTKRPSEEVKIACDFSEKLLPYFGKINSADFSAEKWLVSDPDLKLPGDEILERSSIEIEAPYLTQAKILVAGGEVNYDYHVTCVAHTDDGQIFEQDFFVRIK